VLKNDLAFITDVDLLVCQQEVGLVGLDEQLLEFSEVPALT